jgi:hypothetical protein
MWCPVYMTGMPLCHSLLCAASCYHLFGSVLTMLLTVQSTHATHASADSSCRSTCHSQASFLHGTGHTMTTKLPGGWWLCACGLPP